MRIKIGGISQPTTKRRSPSGRTWGSSKLVGTREFTPQSFSPWRWRYSHRRVEIQVASITGFLPSSDNNKGEYSGTISGPGIPPFPTPLQEAEFRRKQAETQIRDAERRNVMFNADPSPDAVITSEAIDPETPLGIMDDEGNIITNPTDAGTAIDPPDQRVTHKERIIDVGHMEKCVMDVRELVSSLFNLRFRSEVTIVAFV